MRTTTFPRWAAGLVAAALALSACGSSGGSDGAATTTSKATTTTSTTAPSTTTEPSTTTTAVPVGQPKTAVWPLAAGDTRYDDPVAAAQGFAVDYLGFVDPVVGEFQQGDTRSGEVEIRPMAKGPVTTVLVRQVTDDDTWWVLGAATANISLTSPEALAVIGPPVHLSGQSTAFEATVNVEIRADGSDQPLVEDFVMGGSNGDMGPFEKEISFESPNEGGGAIVLKTLSAEDGRIWEATVLRVAFA